MERHERLEKCTICGESRLTREPPLTGADPPLHEDDPPAESPPNKPAGSGHIIEHSSSEFRIE